MVGEPEGGLRGSDHLPVAVLLAVAHGEEGRELVGTALRRGAEGDSGNGLHPGECPGSRQRLPRQEHPPEPDLDGQRELPAVDRLGRRDGRHSVQQEPEELGELGDVASERGIGRSVDPEQAVEFGEDPGPIVMGLRGALRIDQRAALEPVDVEEDVPDRHRGASPPPVEPRQIGGPALGGESRIGGPVGETGAGPVRRVQVHGKGGVDKGGFWIEGLPGCGQPRPDVEAPALDLDGGQLDVLSRWDPDGPGRRLRIGDVPTSVCHVRRPRDQNARRQGRGRRFRESGRHRPSHGHRRWPVRRHVAGSDGERRDRSRNSDSRNSDSRNSDSRNSEGTRGTWRWRRGHGASGGGWRDRDHRALRDTLGRGGTRGPLGQPVSQSHGTSSRPPRAQHTPHGPVLVTSPQARQPRRVPLYRGVPDTDVRSACRPGFTPYRSTARM